MQNPWVDQLADMQCDGTLQSLNGQRNIDLQFHILLN